MSRKKRRNNKPGRRTGVIHLVRLCRPATPAPSSLSQVFCPEFPLRRSLSPSRSLNSGILLLCQTTLARASSEFDYLATSCATSQQPVVNLPVDHTVRTFGMQLFQDTAVDECPSLTVENGTYVCIYGEPASIIFQRAQAHLSEL